MDTTEDMLVHERKRLITKARRVLDDASRNIRDLQHTLELATAGRPYMRTAGTSSTAELHLDLATVYAAFDAIERVALLVPKENE